MQVKREFYSGEDGITEEDTWTVIGAYFDQYSLVSQQIRSYNHFLNTTINEIVEEIGKIVIRPERQFRPTKDDRDFSDGRIYELTFEKVTVYQSPVFKEKEQLLLNLCPLDARLRNLTYEVQLFCDVRFRVYEQEGEQEISSTLHPRIPFCHIPVMVRSQFCYLAGKSAEERIADGECPFDQGGYFIVKGGFYC